MKKITYFSVLICSLLGSNSFAMHKEHDRGDTIDISYRYDGRDCTLYSDRYRIKGGEALPGVITNPRVDTAQCLSRYVVKNGKCIALSVDNDEFSTLTRPLVIPAKKEPMVGSQSRATMANGKSRLKKPWIFLEAKAPSKFTTNH